VRTDRVQVALRRREGLEAVDLGFVLARAAFRPLLTSWLGIVVPFAVLIIAGLREHPFWAVFLLWWLRPVFGRVPLHVLSRTLFSEPTGLLDTLRALPQLARSGIGTSLFLQRLSPNRSMLLPALQLEGLRGRARRARCAVLARRDFAASAALLSAAAHFNAALVFGLLAFARLLVPDAIAWDLSELFVPFLEDSAADPGWLLVPSLYFVGVSCVEPLIAAGGFALYLNRRVDLEGWDIDLAFRNLARRAADTQPTRRRVAGLAAALLLAVLPVRAAWSAPCDPQDPTSARECIDFVLSDPDFGSTEWVTRWALRDFESDEESKSEPWLPLWLAEWLAAGFELALWAGLVVLMITTLVALARRFDATPTSRARPPPLQSRFGLDLDPRSLPPDLLDAARTAFACGAFVEALSLLYRGALVHLSERDGLAIPESATELECVRLARRARTPDLGRVFGELTTVWLAARYADEAPSQEHFESLCLRFAPVFGESAP
jgi:hypothetical protein